jgi:type I restriction-modification system DNA methylase subunit
VSESQPVQLAFPAAAVRDSGLFSEHFLSERLPDWPEFSALDVGGLHDVLSELWKRERDGLPGSNEAQTENRFIQPVLQALGFHYTVQAGIRFGTGRRQPDYALFLSDEHRATADQVEGDIRFRHAVAVADAKKWDRPLDVRGGKGNEAVDPVAQIINYLLITKRDWGILTNGRLWRLYAAKGRLTEGACLEVDLIQLLETGDPADLRWFAAFFSAQALTPGTDGQSLLGRALDESRASAVQVGDALQDQVFSAVPLIAEGLLGEEERTTEALGRAFDHSLVLLYRLLFCLYAEARGLLPVDNPHYEGYSLRKQKVALASDLGAERTFSGQSDDLYNDLRGLFRMVDKGDSQLGVTEYNGGLFSADKHPYFTGRFVSDRLLAQALDLLYRVGGEFVDYRDLSIRHLGTIYERLLDYRLEETPQGLGLSPASGRHETGSYFTPEHIVDAIVERTLAPILDSRSRAVLEEGLQGEVALDKLLDIRVVDPAMGSGHFLVAAAEYIAQHIASDPSFDGYLDFAEARRRVAERCLYGVDLNPMAVELAQLSLWLATVTKDEPLTFLGNLRVGNSLVGVDVLDLRETGDTLFQDELAGNMEKIVAELGEIASHPSETGDDVRAKERHAALATELRQPLGEHASLTLAPAFDGDASGFFHWEIEFPEVFFDTNGQPRLDAGFDAVIGNPPYVRIQELGRQLADYCRKNYEWASGSFDLYLPFLERGTALLAFDGRLGFIVPNKWMKLEYGEYMRASFAGRELVEEIIDFRDAQIFDGATNYTCVLVLAKASTEGFTYRTLGSGTDVRSAAADLNQLEGQEFLAGKLGKRPWVLATGDEGKVLGRIGDGAVPLEEVLEHIFTGLQTSADPIYILEDRGRRGNKRVVFSKASDQEFELEPDLLRRLASGPDVERYSFRDLKSLLLFPYQRIDDGMRLLDSDALDRFPATAAYLAEHEEILRAREGGKMDGDGWYAFGRTQSLGAHDSPKLGVAATVSRLEVAADPDGTTYFHNVRVNGILPKDEGPSLWSLLALLNAKLLDFVFRRGSVDLANGYFAANKQFIASLPIRVPSGVEARTLDGLGERLFAESRAIEEERAGFLTWLGDLCGVAVGKLAGITALSRYDESSYDEVLAILGTAANRRLIVPDSRARSFREQVVRELDISVDRLSILKGNVAKLEETADDAVYDLYELAEPDRLLVESEYK